MPRVLKRPRNLRWLPLPAHIRRALLAEQRAIRRARAGLYQRQPVTPAEPEEPTP